MSEQKSLTISQGLTWIKTLRERREELVQLRNTNSHQSERLFGDKQTVKTKPTYDVKKLDKLVTRLAVEVRHLDEAIKDTNAKTEIIGFKKDESVLGEVE